MQIKTSRKSVYIFSCFRKFCSSLTSQKLLVTFPFVFIGLCVNFALAFKTLWPRKNNFHLSLHCNPAVQFLYLNLALWTRKVAPRRQPIICKIKTNRDNVTRVFPRLRQFSWFDCEFLLAPCDISLILIGFALSLETQSKGTQWLF